MPTDLQNFRETPANRNSLPATIAANPWLPIALPTLVLCIPLPVLYFSIPGIANRLAHASLSAIFQMLLFLFFAWNSIFWGITLWVEIRRAQDTDSPLDFGVDRQIFGLTGEFRYRLTPSTILVILCLTFPLGVFLTGLSGSSPAPNTPQQKQPADTPTTSNNSSIQTNSPVIHIDNQCSPPKSPATPAQAKSTAPTVPIISTKPVASQAPCLSKPE